jgi:large subunit ribosomal protein L10e
MKAADFKYKKNQAHTRRKYMGGIPGSKIVKFTMGNPSKEFTHRVELINIKDVQITHNALESARVAANRIMEKYVGRDDFMLKIIPFPHQVIREHKRVNVAQADRFQEGMKHAYGKPSVTAARIKSMQPIIIAEVNDAGVEYAKIAMKRASAKFPSSCRIVEVKI